jgi:trimeric autotransporter adhesin
MIRRSPLKRLRARVSRNAASQRGDTLVEVLLALIILALASVALITCLETSVTAESEHRGLATFNTILTASSEAALSEMQQQPSLFTSCPTNPVPYYQQHVPITVASPYTSQYSVVVSSVQYWQGLSFGTTCTNNSPQEIQVTATDVANGETHVNSFVATYSANPPEATSGDATQLIFATQPGSGSGGTMLTTQPVVKIEDASGASVLTDLSPVTLALTSGTGPAGATLSGCSGTESLGVITFSGCVISEAGTYTITATDGSLPPVVSNSFSVSASPPSLVFATQPSAGASSDTLSTQPVIDVDNPDGSLDTSFSAAITLSSSNGTLSGCSNLTATSGVVSVAHCSFAGLVGTYYTITATANGVLGAASNSITPSGAGPAAALVFAPEPTGSANSSPSANFSVQPVVRVEDSAGNIVTGYGTDIKLTISSGETLTCNANTVSPTAGKAAWSGCGASKFASNVTVTATSGSLSVTSDPFNITGSFTTLAFTTEPVSVVSGAPLFTQPVVEEQDSNGNVVTSSIVPITLSSSGGTLSLCSGLTPTSGVVNVVSCVFSGTIGTSYTLSASSGSISANSTAFSPTTAGSADKLVFTTQPVAGQSGSALSTQPVVKVEDHGGNVVTSSSRTIMLSSTGTLSGCSNLTAVSGVVNVTGCTFSGAAGTSYTLTASSPGISAATSDDVSVK